MNLDFGHPFRTIKKVLGTVGLRYSNVTVAECDDWEDDAFEILAELGTDVRRLKIVNCKFRRLDAFYDVFESLENLEILQMRNVGRKLELLRADNNFQTRISPIKLEHLKSIFMNDCSLEVSERYEIIIFFY